MRRCDGTYALGSSDGGAGAAFQISLKVRFCGSRRAKRGRYARHRVAELLTVKP